MKYKYVLAITISSFSVLMFNGCGKNDAEPVTSETIEGSVNTEESGETEEIGEPDQGINEEEVIDRETSTGEESTTGGGSDVDMPDDGRTNEETTGNDVIYSGETVTIDGREFKLVGTKGDLSWLRMSESEAQEIVDSFTLLSDKKLLELSDEEFEVYKVERRKYEEASAELLARECNGEYAWTDSTTGEGYYNYYDYQAVVDGFESGVVNVEMAPEEKQSRWDDI